MRFLFLTQYFVPEMGAAQLRLSAIVRELSELGHGVEVVTTMPNYPTGRIFKNYRGRFYKFEVCEGVPIHRVWLYASMGRGLRRYLNYASFTLTCLIGLAMAGKADYIFVESPPLSLSLPAFLFSRLRRIPFIIYTADLWPDAIRSTLGDGQSEILLRLMERLEAWSYRKAAFVCAVTEGIFQNIRDKKGVPVQKILFLPNGVNTEEFFPCLPDNDLRRELGAEGKKVVLYAGNHGYVAGLEKIVEAAQLLKDANQDFYFVFVGDGSAKATLIELAKDLSLDNVIFLNPVSPREVTRLLSISLCGLVSLKISTIAEHIRPAKALAVMASAKPVLFVGGGEGANLVQKAQAGLVVRSGEPKAIAEALQTLANDSELASRLGCNGRKFVEDNLQWSRLVSSWLAELSAKRSQQCILNPSIATDSKQFQQTT